MATRSRCPTWSAMPPTARTRRSTASSGRHSATAGSSPSTAVGRGRCGSCRGRYGGSGGRRSRATRLRMRLGGTVVVTSVGSVGAARGWGLAESGYPATVTVGGISRQPVLINGQLVEREWLRLTVSLDHDVVDGAPAARFVDRLCQLLEQAHGLEEDVRGPGAGGEPVPEPGSGPSRGAAPPDIRWNPTPGAE
jgi:hypothetical protein